MRNSTVGNAIALRALFVLTTLMATALGHAQNLTVTAANSSNDAIYNVVFSNGGGSTTVLNTDAASLHRLTSLVFFSNPASLQLDLLAADNQGGTILRYRGDFGPGMPTAGTAVFTAGGAGPANPDGLSLDAAGNLFVVNAKPGATSSPQLWVLPANGTGGFGTAVSLDANYGSSESLQETLVAGTTIIPPGGTLPVVSPGDLLVLTNNPSMVLKYAGSNGHGPLAATTPSVLLTLPAGTVPGGLAFWPADNSLLITTARGTILQYHLTPNETPTTFADNLGNGQFKIKTGIQAGVPYAYVANNNGGDILQFSGANQLVATVTSGVQHPQGLALTNAAYAPLTACQNQQTNGCDLLGGRVLTHQVPPTLSLTGNVLEDVCVVAVDPRLVPPNNSCTTALPVATVCAGFSSTTSMTVIPASLCGSSGPSGKGFALVKTLTQAYATPGAYPFNGSLIFNDSNLLNILPPSPTDPLCNPPLPSPPPPYVPPLGTLAWAPLDGEGVIVEGNNLMEVTSGCDGGTSKSYGMSLFGVGLSLNTAAVTGGLVGFTSSKYTNLLTTILNETGASALTAASPPTVTAPGNFTYQLQQCISTSQAAFAKAATYYDGAALQVLAADQRIGAVATLAAPFSPVANYPNPSGALRSRLQNIYYTINTRLQGHQASSEPPSPLPPPPPTLSGTPVLKSKAGVLYSFTPTAADFAGNTGTLSFSIAGKPSWASFDTTTGRLSGTTVKGTYPGILISVTDGCASASLPSFTITVN
jgi:hypothetical protein